MKFGLPEPDHIYAILDMNKADDPHWDFGDLSPTEKINKIGSRIEKTYNRIARDYPDKKISVTWRENGITFNPMQQAVSKDDIAHLKKTMKGLIKKYPNLLIVTGATPVSKVMSHSQLKKYLQRYEHPFFQALKNEEEKNKAQHILQVNQFYKEFRNKDPELTEEKLKSLLKEADNHTQVQQHADQLKDINESYRGRINILFRSCYVFFASSEKKVVIKRIDKYAPHCETLRQTHLKFPIAFRPPKENRIQHTFFSPSTRRQIGNSFTVSTCREFIFPIPQDLSAVPDAQFICADSMDIMAEYIRSPIAIYADSLIRPLVAFLPEKMDAQSRKDAKVVWYVTNMYEEDAPLQGPFRPVSRFSVMIINLLENYFFLFDKQRLSLLLEMIKDIRKIFYENMLHLTDEALCKLLEDKMQVHSFILSALDLQKEKIQLKPMMILFESLQKIVNAQTLNESEDKQLKPH